jgi:hypothetical protein
MDATLEYALENFELNRKELLATQLVTTISHLFHNDYLHIVVQPGELSVIPHSYFHIDYSLISVLPPQLLGLG